jgi:CheY-like chemotaxis protein
MRTRKIKRILLAESPEVMPLAYASFGVRDSDLPLIGASESGTLCQIVPCSSLGAAMSALRHDIDLIVCGLHFDESRMFDLLRAVKADPATRDIPFLCVKAISGALDRTIYESIKISTRALGAEDFYDLSEERERLGEKLAVRQIGEYIYRLVSANDLEMGRGRSL